MGQKKISWVHRYGDSAGQCHLTCSKECPYIYVVAVNDHRKLLVGYFLIDGLNGTERSNLVLKFLEKHWVLILFIWPLMVQDVM